MGHNLSFLSRVFSILSLPFLLYTILPFTTALFLLKGLKLLATLTIIQFALREAFYPLTWLYTAEYQNTPAQPDPRWRQQRV